MTPPFNLQFDNEFQYRDIPGLDPSLLFPALIVGIVGPTGAEDLLAIVDTGAAYSLFNGKRAKSIGLDLHSGQTDRPRRPFRNPGRTAAPGDFGAFWREDRLRGGVQRVRNSAGALGAARAVLTRSLWFPRGNFRWLLPSRALSA
jgi:hypothetical protein